MIGSVKELHDDALDAQVVTPHLLDKLRVVLSLNKDATRHGHARPLEWLRERARRRALAHWRAPRRNELHRLAVDKERVRQWKTAHRTIEVLKLQHPVACVNNRAAELSQAVLNNEPLHERHLGTLDRAAARLHPGDRVVVIPVVEHATSLANAQPTRHDPVQTTEGAASLTGMNAEVVEPLILVARDGAITRVTLNRPRAINALNTEMFAGLDTALDEAAGSAAVVLDGAGERGFCGGGDIKQIAFGGDPRALFGAEYRVDYRVSASPVPVVAIMDGIAMGGGIGLGGHAAYRVVTERSRLAMPEARIGIMPDVGGHYLLANAPGRLGEYLAITASEMGPADAIALGFADALVPSDRIAAFRQALAGGDSPADALAEFAVSAGEAPLLAVRDWFDPIADAALTQHDALQHPVAATTALVHGLEASELPAAQAAAVTVRDMCPVSLAVTIAQLARTRAAQLDVAGVLEDDYRIVPRLAVQANFAEGVRAQLIDKDRNPAWQPARVEDLSETDIAALLAPHAEGEPGLTLPRN